MILEERIELLVKLGKYLISKDDELEAIKTKSFEQNKWFTREFIDTALSNIAEEYLERHKLERWVKSYHLDDNIAPKNIGIVMAGNIPLAGFHDFLCTFITGHYQKIKLSEKDAVLLPFILNKMSEWSKALRPFSETVEVLKNCDAYITAGNNNSSRYFEYYFGKYPSIIRKNKTSVGILNGSETEKDLAMLCDDIHTYFGMGCRNVSSIRVPANYDFIPLLNACRKFDYFSDHSKYRNNYDYNLALLIMNNRIYMSSKSKIFLEEPELFSPISQLHYSYYDDKEIELRNLKNNDEIQCICGGGMLSFGTAQKPKLITYADDIDTMQFLLGL